MFLWLFWFGFILVYWGRGEDGVWFCFVFSSETTSYVSGFSVWRSHSNVHFQVPSCFVAIEEVLQAGYLKT